MRTGPISPNEANPVVKCAATKRCVTKLKQLRAVATRYDKNRATADIATMMIWLRDLVKSSCLADSRPVRLIDAAGYGVDLRVVGYQFPDAEDLSLRHSWHVVEGTATSPEGSWRFRYPALTCDDSVYVARWLRRTAGQGLPPAGTDAAPGVPPILSFTEPNLSMTLVEHSATQVVLDIGLDVEFSPPWAHRPRAGGPFTIRCSFGYEQLERAAAEWEHEIALYPAEPV
ncbi:hypothetical protein QLQ12_43685 [Actinoplanes sp. NEAU-A12]|uniref:Uncharacterized protein n=1 Tax=Actinoplanes sandaracinus TaxID=3045177 RepID=A0ABT6X0G9_9ACTN|nr:hypothetical protein [Actinoplanes sandaracinus]MDI6105506.1 hypothetical protein [Actinoplanes sandaracinus]